MMAGTVISAHGSILNTLMASNRCSHTGMSPVLAFLATEDASLMSRACARMKQDPEHPDTRGMPARKFHREWRGGNDEAEALLALVRQRVEDLSCDVMREHDSIVRELLADESAIISARFVTAIECERAQGFPDEWTDGQARSHRLHQLGNAVTVNVAQWLARRIVAAQTRFDFMEKSPERERGGEHMSTPAFDTEHLSQLANESAGLVASDSPETVEVETPSESETVETSAESSGLAGVQ